MKFLTSQMLAVFKAGEARRNLRLLYRFMILLVGMIILYSVLFHFIMAGEDQRHSWITGFYWTLTVMSTLGFGDITFQTDLGRIFSIVVLLSGVFFLLIVLPFTFIQFFYAPWLEAQMRQRARRSRKISQIAPSGSATMNQTIASPETVELRSSSQTWKSASATPPQSPPMATTAAAIAIPAVQRTSAQPTSLTHRAMRSVVAVEARRQAGRGGLATGSSCTSACPAEGPGSCRPRRCTGCSACTSSSCPA